MANGIITLSTTRDVLEGRIVWESASNGSAANSSYVAGHLQVRRNDGYTTKGTWSGAMRIGGTVQEFSRASTSVGSDWVTMLEFYINQGHNADGTGSVFFEAYCNGPAGTSMAGESVSGNQTVTLDTIPRYAEINNFYVQSVGLDSVTLYYNVSRTAHIYCSVDGKLWGNPKVTNTASGTFTIKDLTPNQQHSFIILSRAVDNGLDRISGTIYATTKDIGKISVLNNFKHGDNIKLTTTNPSRS